MPKSYQKHGKYLLEEGINNQVRLITKILITAKGINRSVNGPSTTGSSSERGRGDNPPKK